MALAPQPPDSGAPKPQQPAADAGAPVEAAAPESSPGAPSGVRRPQPNPASAEPKPSGATKPAPRRRRRDGALVGYLSGVFTFLTLAALAVGGLVYWGKSEFDSPGPLASATTVMIQRNQGVGEIADSLERAGVISNANVFKAGVGAYGAKDKLRFGEYAFPANVSMREAMEIIVSGKSIEHALTIPEGLTSLQIVDRLRDQPMLTGDVKDTPPEGSLLPETYKFTRGATREQMIARMKQHRDQVVAEVWRTRDPSVRVKTPDELVTLASLVEKETGIAAERPQVAGVFANRLARGMRLQSDPTIVYGLVGGRGTLGRSLTRADIQSRTPYNTYVVPGLPAGPIANPGRQALEAAARPAKTKDLYFVADGSGGHAFAPSLVEHNKNVGRWRQLEKTRGAPADRLAPDEQTPESARGESDGESADATGAAGPSSSGSDQARPKPRPAPAQRQPRPQ